MTFLAVAETPESGRHLTSLFNFSGMGEVPIVMHMENVIDQASMAQMLIMQECPSDCSPNRTIEQLRNNGIGTPVMIVEGTDHSARERAMMLDVGIDMLVPYNAQPEMFLASLKALTRRLDMKDSEAPIIAGSNGGLKIYERSARVLIHGKPLELTANEYKVLLFLVKNAGKVVTRSETVLACYNGDESRLDRFVNPSNTLEVFISRIRNTIARFYVENPNVAPEVFLRTLFKEGYQMAKPGGTYKVPGEEATPTTRRNAGWPVFVRPQLH